MGIVLSIFLNLFANVILVAAFAMVDTVRCLILAFQIMDSDQSGLIDPML